MQRTNLNKVSPTIQAGVKAKTTKQSPKGVARPKAKESSPQPSPKAVYIEDIPNPSPTLTFSPDELASRGLVRIESYVLSRAAKEKSKEALKAEKKRAKQVERGIAQVNTDAPRVLHAAIKAFAGVCRNGGTVRDAVLALLCALPVAEMLDPTDLRDLEAALVVHQQVQP